MTGHESNQKRSMISRTSILVLCLFLLPFAALGWVPPHLQLYVLLAGIAGLISFVGLDTLARRRSTESEPEGNLTQRLRKHTSQPAKREEKSSATAAKP